MQDPSHHTEAETLSDDEGEATAVALPTSVPEAGYEEDAVGGEEDTEEGAQGHERPKHRAEAKPGRASIMERFALAQGFKKDNDGRYFRSDGSWISKSHGARFPWERRTLSGELVRYYWPEEHCLEAEPLQVEADVWGLIDATPETYALILENVNGDPVEMGGDLLCAMKTDGRLRLYPAAYRLAIESESPEVPANAQATR